MKVFLYYITSGSVIATTNNRSELNIVHVGSLFNKTEIKLNNKLLYTFYKKKQTSVPLLYFKINFSIKYSVCNVTFTVINKYIFTNEFNNTETSSRTSVR